MAAFYNNKRFVFFIPHRHGHGRSPGEYIVDVNELLVKEHKGNEEAAWKDEVALHDVYNTDVAAAVEWLKSQPYVDKNRIVMSGVSYGGIQTLVSAERISGIKRKAMMIGTAKVSGACSQWYQHLRGGALPGFAYAG